VPQVRHVNLWVLGYACRLAPGLVDVREPNSPLAGDLFVQELERARDEMDFELVGYVVMREHVHPLISEPAHGSPSTVLHTLKLHVSRKMRKKIEIVESCLPECSRRFFWFVGSCL
jgi:hypothetical protein